MSNTSNSSGLSSELAGIALMGGIPTSMDFAPSVIFAAAYALMIIPLAIRWTRPSSRTNVLLRPIIFATTQTTAFVLRAVISRGNYSQGIFIAGSVFLLAGFLLICEPSISMFTAMVTLHSNSQKAIGKETALVRVTRVLHLAIIAAIAVAIWASVKISPNESKDDRDTIQELREANAGIVIGVEAIITLGVLFLFSKGAATLRQVLIMLPMIALILVVAVYKLVTASSPTNPLATGTKVAFYLLLALPQFLVIGWLAIFNIRDAFFPPTYTEDDAKDYEMENRA